MAVLDYGSGGWRYLDGASGHSSGFQAPAFDDSAWAVGAMPFGTGTISGHAAATTVSLASVVGSVRDLCVRKTVGPFGSVRIHGAADDGLAIWFNGTLILDDLSVEDSPSYDNFSVETTIGSSGVLAIRRRDVVSPGGINWLDLAIDALGGWGVGQVRMGAN